MILGGESNATHLRRLVGSHQNSLVDIFTVANREDSDFLFIDLQNKATVSDTKLPVHF
jgi:hypothetical protein